MELPPRMHIAILHNSDHDLLEEDPGREAREDVIRVAGALHEALATRGFQPKLVPVGDDLTSFTDVLRQMSPLLVVNLCESLAADSRGEMAVPCLLDLLGLPYTGSGSLALGLALHKDKAKAILRAHGVPTPEFAVVETVEDVMALELPFPLIVKPSREDASMGVEFDSVVHDRRGLAQAAKRVLRDFDQPALVERFIPGREIYVSLLGNEPRIALPLSEIQFGQSFAGKPNIVSYRAKWDVASPECIDSPSRPCHLPAGLETRVIQTAKAAFDALDCRDYGRVDLRVTEDGQPFVIDVNPNCDLHPEAGFARAASAAGISYPDLALRLVETALERNHGNSTRRTSGQRTARRAARANRDVLAGGDRVRARAD